MKALIVLGKLMQFGALILVFSIVRGTSLPLGLPEEHPVSSAISVSNDNDNIDCDGVNCVRHGRQRAAFLPDDRKMPNAEFGEIGEHSNEMDSPKGPIHLWAYRFRRAPEEDYSMEEEASLDPYYYEGSGAEGVGGKKRLIGITVFVVWVCWICIVLSVLRLVAKNLA